MPNDAPHLPYSFLIMQCCKTTPVSQCATFDTGDEDDDVAASPGAPQDLCGNAVRCHLLRQAAEVAKEAEQNKKASKRF